MVSFMASFVLSFFPLDVLDEIWDLIESVSEGFLTYSCIMPNSKYFVNSTPTDTQKDRHEEVRCLIKNTVSNLKYVCIMIL